MCNVSVFPSQTRCSIWCSKSPYRCCSVPSFLRSHLTKLHQRILNAEPFRGNQSVNGSSETISLLQWALRIECSSSDCCFIYSCTVTSTHLVPHSLSPCVPPINFSIFQLYFIYSLLPLFTITHIPESYLTVLADLFCWRCWCVQARLWVNRPLYQSVAIIS